ncbi:MAG: hypothetical protein J7K82_04675 [Thermoproteales archaeon]|nr:hypothetical protein [Thermoproteales archaeon]
MKAAVSFYHEQGVFVKDEYFEENGVSENFPAIVLAGDLGTIEVLKKFSEIDVEKEAIALFAYLGKVMDDHYSFLQTHEITKKLGWKKSSPFPFRLSEISDEFKVEKNSFFKYLFRSYEKLLEKLLSSHSNENIYRILEEEGILKKLYELLVEYYSQADCIIGSGTYFSLYQLNMDLIFGVCELELTFSKSILDRPLTVNPYLLYHLLKNVASLRRKNIEWKYLNLTITPANIEYATKIDEITLKCYIVSDEVYPLGLIEEKVKEHIHSSLLEYKRYIFSRDFVFPFSTPSIVLEVKGKDSGLLIESTPYGPVLLGPVDIPTITNKTEIRLKFYNFPLFNKHLPVILDTSSLDIARFPFSIKSLFFTAFLMDRKIVIPKAVLFEIKTRLKHKKDRARILKALYRLRNMKTWGFIKDIEITGEIPSNIITLPSDTKNHNVKKRIEDLIDTIVLSTCLNLNAILFTNDTELAKYALSLGIKPISYNGLIDDLLDVLRTHNLEYDEDELIKATREYAEQVRGVKYEESDIKDAIKALLNEDKIGITKKDSKEIFFIKKEK